MIMINSISWLVDKDKMMEQLVFITSELELEGNIIEEITIKNEKGMRMIEIVYLEYDG